MEMSKGVILIYGWLADHGLKKTCEALSEEFGEIAEQPKPFLSLEKIFASLSSFLAVFTQSTLSKLVDCPKSGDTSVTSTTTTTCTKAKKRKQYSPNDAKRKKKKNNGAKCCSCSNLGALQLETMREDRTPLPPPKPVEKKNVSWNTPVASPCAEAVDGKLALLTPGSTHTHPVDRKVTPRTHEGTPVDISYMRATSPSPVKTPIKAVDTNITPQIHLAAPSTKPVEVKKECETETEDTDDPDLNIPLSYFKENTPGYRISNEFQGFMVEVKKEERRRRRRGR